MWEAAQNPSFQKLSCWIPPVHVFLEAFAHINHCLLTSGTRKEHAAWHTAHMCCNYPLQAALQRSLGKFLCDQQTKPDSILLIFFMCQAHCSLLLPDDISAALHPWDYQTRCFSLMASRKDISTCQMLFVYLGVPVSEHSLTKLQFQEKQCLEQQIPSYPGWRVYCSLTEAAHRFACIFSPKYRRYGQRSSS